jgi:YXWGXW repeat-containing protein
MVRKILLGTVFLLSLTMMSACASRGYYGGGGGYYGPRVPPPAPRYGPAGYAPGPGYVWCEGFWDWRDRWVWSPGQWARPPHVRATWVPGRWNRGSHGQYEFRRGHWR